MARDVGLRHVAEVVRIQARGFAVRGVDDGAPFTGVPSLVSLAVSLLLPQPASSRAATRALGTARRYELRITELDLSVCDSAGESAVLRWSAGRLGGLLGLAVVGGPRKPAVSGVTGRGIGSGIFVGWVAGPSCDRACSRTTVPKNRRDLTTCREGLGMAPRLTADDRLQRLITKCRERVDEAQPPPQALSHTPDSKLGSLAREAGYERLSALFSEVGRSAP